MRYLLITIACLLSGITGYAKPHCQSFSNHDGKVTIIFTDDDRVKEDYTVSDARLIATWFGKEYEATSIKISIKDGEATVILTFPHMTQFSNPKVELRINGKKRSFKVCR